MEFGGLRGFQEDRTDRTVLLAKFQPIWWYMVSVSPLFNIFGKLTFQSTRNGIQNPPFCPGSLQDTFIIYSSISHQHISKIFSKKKIAIIENLEIQKPRFTNRSPERKGPYSLMDFHWYSLMDIHQWISMDIQFCEIQFFEIQFFENQFHEKPWKTMNWALVSEPGFLKFHIFRFSILEILFGGNIFENYVGEISRNK